jgi:hypothetical protein
MRNDIFPLPLFDDFQDSTRKRIQEHPNFGAWYLSLGEDTRTAFDLLYLTDVTPELIHFTRQVPEPEWWQSVFLRVISGGDPDPMAKTLLTQHALLTVIADIEAFGRRSKHRLVS